jgi:hypothetical protein
MTCRFLFVLLLLGGAFPHRSHAESAVAAQLDGATMGINLFTVHSKSTYNWQNGVDVPPTAFKRFTPGLYVRTTSGWTAGLLSNSVGDTSALFGFTWETRPSTLPLQLQAALTLGGIAGYGIAPVVPLVVPSLRIPVRSGCAARISYLGGEPGDEHAVSAAHLSLEWVF